MALLTYWLQVVLSLSFGAFGVLSLLVGRHPDPNGPFRSAGWRLAGVAFLSHACVRVIQNVWQRLVFHEPLGSPALERYLDWAPIFNHSRTFLLVGFCGLLIALVVRKEPPGPRFWRTVPAVLAGGLVLGGTLGYFEGTLRAVIHYTNVSLLDLLEVVVLFGVLFAALATSRMDRLLWAALGLYAFMLTLNVVFMLAFAAKDDASAWSPPAWVLPAYRSVLTWLMVALAARKLVLARRGTPVPALLESGSRRPAAMFPG